MTATRLESKQYGVRSLDTLEPDGRNEQRVWFSLRRELDIGAFGANAARALQKDVELVHEHDETGPGRGGHEELYLVVSGHATFTVDGEDVDAPAGTFVFVRDPSVKRKALAHEAGTTVLSLGGRRGQAFVPSPWETTHEMWAPYEAGAYHAAIEILERGLEDHPGNPMLLYNLASCESLVGRKTEALEHLEAALAGHEPYREHAPGDSDFEPLRGDPAFETMLTS